MNNDFVVRNFINSSSRTCESTILIPTLSTL